MSNRKKVLAAILSIVGVFVIWTLVSLVWTGSGDGSREYPNRRWRGLRLEVENVTPEGLTLSMVNRYVLPFNHGVGWYVEQYIDGEWVQPPINPNIAWTLPLLHVFPMQRVREDVNFVWVHGALPPGQYRILRSFNSGVFLYAPFTV